MGNDVVLYGRSYRGTLSPPDTQRDCSNPGTFRYLSRSVDDTVGKALGNMGTGIPNSSARCFQGNDGTLAFFYLPEEWKSLRKPKDCKSAKYCVEVRVQSPRADRRLPSELIALLEGHGFKRKRK